MPRTLPPMLAAFAVAAGGCQAVERHLVFRPTHTPEPPAGAAGIRLSGAAPDRRAYPLDLTTGDGTPVRAWWCPVPGAGAAVLYCHGNAGDLSDRVERRKPGATPRPTPGTTG